MTVAVVVDSTADIPQAMRDELGIAVIPLSVIFGNESFLDGVEITNDQFYTRLVEGNVHPSTSQPSPGLFAELYEKLAQDHEGIISIHLSGKLSGTVRSAEQAKELVPNVPIRVIDSNSVSLGIGFLGLEAAKLAREGQSLDQIAERIESLVPKIHLWVAFDTLKYLERGGRIGRTRAFLGTLLNVKPIAEIRGEVLPSEQVRTFKKAMARVVELASAQAPYHQLAVMYTTSRPEAETVADMLSAIHPRAQIVVAQLSSVLGVHGGPGLIGVTGISRE